MSNQDRIDSLKRSLDYAIQELEEHRRRGYVEDQERVTYHTPDGQSVDWNGYEQVLMQKVQNTLDLLMKLEIPFSSVRIV
jgi:hypothetical protein